MDKLGSSVLLLLLACRAARRGAKGRAAATDDAAIEARMQRITSELRCLVCQNETIAGSSAGLAEDLRTQVREMLRKGQSDEQIIKYMTDRYGDFVLYRPPLKGNDDAVVVRPGRAARGRARRVDPRAEAPRAHER